jgi:hypothetical protein
MSEILSRDDVILVTIEDLTPASSLGDADEIPISQSGVVRKTNIGDLFDGATDAALTAVDNLETQVYLDLGDYVNRTSAQEIDGVKTFLADVEFDANVGINSTSVFTGLATFDAQVDFDSDVNVNSTSIFTEKATFNGDIECNSQVDFDSVVNLNSTSEFTGTATFNGSAVFNNDITVPNPTSANHAVRKSYVDAIGTAFTSHEEDTNNPHEVTPEQLGNDAAQWNANKIQGVTVHATPPTDGQALLYNSLNTRYEPGTITGITTSAQTIDGAKTFSDVIYANGFDSGVQVQLETSSGVASQLSFADSLSGSPRWTIGKTTATESGSESGSNFEIKSYNDDGSPRDDILEINRNTGIVDFSVSPTAPTPSAADSTSKLATTEFVTTADNLKANIASPTFTGNVIVPQITDFSTNDLRAASTNFVQGVALSLAPKTNPTLTGTVTIPTPSTTDDSTKAASTAFVKDQPYEKVIELTPIAANIDCILANYSTSTITELEYELSISNLGVEGSYGALITCRFNSLTYPGSGNWNSIFIYNSAGSTSAGTHSSILSIGPVLYVAPDRADCVYLNGKVSLMSNSRILITQCGNYLNRESGAYGWRGIQQQFGSGSIYGSAIARVTFDCYVYSGSGFTAAGQNFPAGTKLKIKVKQ